MDKDAINKLAHNIVERMVGNFIEEHDEETINNTLEWVVDEIEERLESERIEALNLYPRCCNHTNTGMSEGFVVGDDYPLQAYLETVLLEDCVTAGYKSLKEAYEQGFYYYTQWEYGIEELEEQGFCYDADGQEYDYDELSRNWSKVV